MTTQSAMIAKLLNYSVTDWAVSAGDEAKIINLFRTDPSIDATVAALAKAGVLDVLFDRVDSGNNPEILAQVLGGAVSRGSAGLINGVLAKRPALHKTFNICAGLHQKLRSFGVLTPGAVIAVDGCEEARESGRTRRYQPD